MTWIYIIAVAILLFILVFLWAALKVASDADDEMEKMFAEKQAADEKESDNQDSDRQ